MATADGIGGSAAVAGWSGILGELHERRSRRVERKNGWQMSEAIGERDPQGVKRLLNSARWDADEARDEVCEYVVEHLGDEEMGVLIVAGTGFLKKGEKCVGVALHA